MAVYDDQLTDNDQDTLAQQEAAFAGPDATDSGSKKLANSQSLRDKEKSVPKEDSKPLASGNPDEGLRQRVKNALWGSKVRRRSTVGTGIVGLIIAAVTSGSVFLSGPFQMIHIAQFLQKAHFSQQEDASDGRVGKLYRFLRSGGDVGETRLNYLGSRYKTQMLADLERIGLKPIFGSAKIYTGFEIDTKNVKSPYYGLDEEGVKAKLAEKGVTSDIAYTKDGKLTVTTKGYFGGDGSKASLRLLTKDLGYKGISAALRWRILAKYGLATWHPLTKLDAKLNGKFADAYAKWAADRAARYKTGIKPATVDTSGARTESTDAEGHTTSTPVSDADKAAAAAALADTEKSSNIIKQLAESKTAQLAGGVAAAQMVVCSLKAVADDIGNVRYTQVVKPLMRMSMDAVTSGNQAMSGKDINMLAASFAAQSYNGKDPDTGKLTNWYQAESIQAEAGRANTGIAAPEEMRDIGKGIPEWLIWTQDGKVAAACSTTAQVAGGVLSVTLGLISGGIISTASGLLTGFLLVPKAISAAANYLAGEAVNVNATGAQWGNSINYGARLSANTAALQFAGTELSTDEELALKQQAMVADAQDFSSHSFAYRLLDLGDSRSFASNLLDRSSLVQPTNIAYSFATLVTGLAGMPKLLASQLTATTHAAAVYDYGFTKIGFSDSDLNSSAVEDPYANATAAAALLDGSDGQQYIDKASRCFGVKLEKGSEGWDVLPGTDVNVFANDYDAKDCRGAGDINWLKIRFFIFDTGTMEGWACYQGDDKSCENSGATTASGSTAEPSPSVDFVIGTYNQKNDLPDAKHQTAVDNIVNQGMDVVGTQETGWNKYSYYRKALADKNYGIWPETNYDAWNQLCTRDTAIVYNKAKFKLVKHDLVSFPQYPLDAVNDCGNGESAKAGFANAPIVWLQDIGGGTSNGQTVIVMNTHNLANVDLAKGVNPALRRKQSAEIYVEKIQSLKKENPGMPILFTGDFNEGTGVRTSGNLTLGQPDPAAANNLLFCMFAKNGFMVSAAGPAMKCENNGIGGVDYIYTTPEVQVDWTKRLQGTADSGGVAASDHDALYAKVSVPGASAGAGDVTIGSFNVLGASHTGGFEGRADKAIRVITGQKLDVVGLQEFQVKQRAYFLQNLTNYDIFPAANSKDVHHSVQNSIIWDKSKFRQVESGFQPNLGYFCDRRLDAPYVRLESVDRTKPFSFYVLNTHDPANSGNNACRNDAPRIRYNNAVEHVKLINTLKSKGIPIFYTGDFNSKYALVTDTTKNGSPWKGDPKNLTYCVFANAGIKDSYDLKTGRNITCPNSTPPGNGGGIDHIYISAPGAVKVTNYANVSSAVNGSDHPTVLATFSFGGSGSSAGSGSTSTDAIGGVRNFRDAASNVSGILKRGVLYRSAELSGITPSGSGTLAGKLGSNGTIIDLRTAAQRSGAQDGAVSGSRNVSIPIKGILDQAPMVNDASRRSQVAKALRTAANADGPVLVHCVAGKDRTGWVVAMIMYVNGASESQMMEEYMASQAAFPDGVKQAWLNSGFNAARQEYGSLNGYLKRGLGLSDADINKIKQKFGT